MTTRFEKIRQFIWDEVREHYLIIFLILAYVLYFSIYTIIKNQVFYSAELDLGNMQQTLWNTLHGHFFMESDPTGKALLISRFGDHVDPLLLVALPFYYFFPNANTLLILQSIVVALG